MDKLRRYLNGDDRDDDSATGIFPDVLSCPTSYVFGWYFMDFFPIVDHGFRNAIHRTYIEVHPDDTSKNMDATTLSWETRIKGFILCFVLGIIISLFGSLALFLGKGLTLFAVFYTLGNIVSMLSTCFLMGPVNQMKKMFASTRIVATIVALSMIVVTFFVAIHLKNAPLSLLSMILQWLAMTWYSISYIPYARDAVRKTFETCIA